MADDKTFPCCKDLFRLSECIRVPTNRLQHWSIRKQPPCLSAKTGPETRTYVPSSFRVQNIRARQSFAREWHMVSHSARYIRWSGNDKGWYCTTNVEPCVNVLCHSVVYEGQQFVRAWSSRTRRVCAKILLDMRFDGWGWACFIRRGNSYT